MASPAPRPETATRPATASILGRPLHPVLAQFPTVCFIGALVTDVAYAESANMQWANFSVWLITAGLVMGALAAVAGLIDHFGDRRVRAARGAMAHMLIGIAVYVIELFNAFVHSRDGWTSVVPTGLVLSAVGVVLLLVGGWFGARLVYRHDVGVSR